MSVKQSAEMLSYAKLYRRECRNSLSLKTSVDSWNARVWPAEPRSLIYRSEEQFQHVVLKLIDLLVFVV